MHVLLVQPRCARALDVEYVSLQFPLNLGYLAAVLREAGHSVGIVDLNVQAPETLDRELRSRAPGLVGIGSMTANYPQARVVARRVRELLPTAHVTIGGAHASALPERVLAEEPSFDTAVFGEGERTVVELAAAVAADGDLSAIDGLAWRLGGTPMRNAPRAFLTDLDSLPFPARDLVPLSLYNRNHASRGFSRKRLRIAELITSRGCPHNCIFCASRVSTGVQVRARSVGNVLAEVDECVDRFGIEHFSIEDDTFTFRRDNVIEFCAHFRRRGVTWNCNARVNDVDPELLRIMARSGCLKVSFGVESGSERVLRKVGKGISVDGVRAAVRAAREAGIRFVECTFLLGSHPDETLEDIELTRKLIDELGADLTSVCVTCPYPGTAYARLLEKRGFLPPDPDWSQYVLFGDVRPYERLTHLSREELNRLQRDLIRGYYGSPRYILRQLRKLRSLDEARYMARLGLLFVREFLLREVGGAWKRGTCDRTERP